MLAHCSHELVVCKTAEAPQLGTVGRVGEVMSSVKGGEEEIRQGGRAGGGRELRSMKAEGRRRSGG